MEPFACRIQDFPKRTSKAHVRRMIGSEFRASALGFQVGLRVQGLNLLVPSLSAAFGPKAMQWLREGFTKVFARGVRVWGVGYDSGRHH